MLLGFNNEIFRIPIYNESSDEFYEYLEESRDKSISKLIERSNPSTAEFYREYYTDPDNRPHPNPEKISWQYNRIIGWIELYLDGQKIKAELWKIRLKRIPKNFNPNYFDRKGKISDVCSANYRSSDEIKARIKEFFQELGNGDYGYKWLKKRHIDTELFFKQLEYIDIKKMIEQES